MARLEGPRRKLKRARKHLDDINERLHTFDALNPHAVEKEFDAEASEYFLHADLPEPPDIELLNGDFVHNARSALDHAVYALIHEGRKGEVSGTGFPVFNVEDHFVCRGKPMIAKLPKEAQTLITGMQPYACEDPGTNLSILASLSNLDKHRQIPVVAYATEKLMVMYMGNSSSWRKEGEVARPPFGRLKNERYQEGHVEAILPVTRGAEVDFNASVTVGVAFRKGRGIPYDLVGTRLDQIYEAIENNVLPQLEAFSRG